MNLVFFIFGIPKISWRTGKASFFLGGDMEGNWVTGSWVMASTPRNTMISEITIDRTGRCINLLNIELCY